LKGTIELFHSAYNDAGLRNVDAFSNAEVTVTSYIYSEQVPKSKGLYMNHYVSKSSELSSIMYYERYLQATTRLSLVSGRNY